MLLSVSTNSHFSRTIPETRSNATPTTRCLLDEADGTVARIWYQLNYLGRAGIFGRDQVLLLSGARAN